MGERKMGAAEKIKIMCLVKKARKADIADKLGMNPQSFYNKLARDAMSYNTAEKIADLLGFDIIFRDRKTGKEY